MTFRRLRAKSGGGDYPCASFFLPGHLADAYRAAIEVTAATADAQLGALGLDRHAWRDRLVRTVLLAAAVHDLGKANHQFQEMVHGDFCRIQAIRHEWITLLILQRPGWREWLVPALAEPEDWNVVLWAIGGHHASRQRTWPETLPASGDAELRLLLGHPDLMASQEFLRAAFELGKPPAEADCALYMGTAAPPELARLLLQARSVWNGLRRPDPYNAEKCRFVAAVKASLVAADVAGSALPRTALAPAEHAGWIRQAFSCVPTPSQIQHIVTDRLTDQGQVRTPRPFQVDVSASSSRVTLVTAGCGTGKTLAAYMWSARQAPGRRLYMCYPTTGTATEGYRDYLFDQHILQGKFGAELFHGRAAVDLEEILGCPEDDTFTGLESLDPWSTPIVSCTVDTVLGLMWNGRRGLLNWPALAGAAFVFDEIHAYDDKLFGTLIRFLQTFRGVPVLLMTASLPEARRAELERRLQAQGESLALVPGPAELEVLQRYRRADGLESQSVAAVRAETARGGKVLWVCNTVNRAMQAAQLVSDLCPLLYHSRYRYIDRVQRHAAVIDAFKATGPALAICTQVAEMSLDLSATLLVTDLAAVPALIQRLGRLNRKALPGATTPMPFLVIDPGNTDADALPYEKEDLAKAREWLARLGSGPLSQMDLAREWATGQAVADVQACRCGWIEGGPETPVDSPREAAPGLTVLLESDVAPARADTQEFTRRLLPMPSPRRLPWRSWPTVRGVPVAPANTIIYDTQRGGTWAV